MDILKAAKRLKIGEKRIFDASDLYIDEIQDVARRLEADGFATYVSSGTLAVERRKQIRRQHRSQSLKERLKASPKKWDYKMTADIAKMYAVTTAAAYKALKSLEEEGFENPSGGSLMHNDGNLGRNVRPASAHFVWFFQ